LVTSRGPLCTAGFVRSTNDLMIDLVEKPAWAHKLIDLCTRLIIDWLKAQAKAMGPTVEGIFILDDIVGFINEEHYQEFAHPYLKRICEAFPKDWVKIYHNDAEVDACLDHLPDCGFNVLNWGKQKDIAEVKARWVTSTGPGSQVFATRCDLDHPQPYPAGPTVSEELLPADRTWHLAKTRGELSVTVNDDGSATWNTALGQSRTVTPYDYLLTDADAEAEAETKPDHRAP